MRSFLAAILVMATVLTAATGARADDDPADATKHEPEQTWYGAQTLATDGAAIALALAAGASSRSTDVMGGLFYGSLATYALGGPIVHIAHGRGRIAAADLVVRVTSPVAAAVVGYAIGSAAAPATSCEGDGPCGGGIVGGILGLGAGFLAASIVDAAVFAYEPATRDASAIRIVPSVTVVPQGREGAFGTLGASGSF